MNDRRIFNLLIVDPDRDEHRDRIKELSSRRDESKGCSENFIEKVLSKNEEDFEKLFSCDQLNTKGFVFKKNLNHLIRAF